MEFANFSAAYLAKYPAAAGLLRHVAQALGLAVVTTHAPAGEESPAQALDAPQEPAQEEPQAQGLAGCPLIPWEAWTAPGCRAVRAWLLAGQGSPAGICANSGAQYLARIRAILNEAKFEPGLAQLICSDSSRLLAGRQIRSRGIYLSSDMLHGLENFTVPADTRRDMAASMEIARLLALISGRTGARASDVIRFSPANIRGGLLTYVPKKTKDTSGRVCVVPVGPKTMGWIARVTELAKDIDVSTEKAEKTFYVRYERALKAICHLIQGEGWDDEVVIFEQNEQRIKIFRDCVTSHTLRHSFATNMYLDDEVGGDIYAISQMLGHTTVDMTMSYICVPFNEKKMAKVKYFE